MSYNEMSYSELMELIDSINSELEYIYSLLQFFSKSGNPELYNQNFLYGQNLLQQRLVLEEVYTTRFYSEIEDELYDRLEQLSIQ